MAEKILIDFVKETRERLENLEALPASTSDTTDGASKALDNLASVAINTSLISDTDATDNIGSAAIKWLQGFFNRLTLEEGGSTATPAADDVAVYAKADGLVYSQDDAGTETLMSGVVDASTTVKGKVELATSSETTTGTDTDKGITPDGLAGSDYGKRIIEIMLLDNDTALAVEDGIASIYFTVPIEINGWNLVLAHAATPGTASTSGTPTIQIYNLTDTVDMLSTKITIDATEKTSYTATTQPVIDTANDDVSTGDLIRFDCDVAGTGTKGLSVILTFQLP